MELPSLAPPTPLDIPDPGNRVTTQTTTSDTPQGSTQTQVVEQRTVQQGHVGFWEESEGVWSLTRLLSSVSIGAAIVFGVLAMFIPQAATTGVTLAGMFAGAGWAGKLVQRGMEEKGPLKE